MSLKLILNILTELSLVSTAYGIPNLVRSKHFYQKILWIFFILTSSIISIILIREAILSFLEFKVVTLTETIYEQPSEFPTITLCGLTYDYFKGKQPKEIIKECYFGYDNKCNDSNSLFEAFYSDEDRYCYRFNSGKNYFNESIPILYSTIGGLDDSFYLRISENQDMFILIHNKSLSPLTMFKNNHDKNRLLISSNSFNFFQIKKVIEKKLSEPYNECLNDVNEFKLNKTIINYILKKKQIYKQENCLELCFDIDYIERNPCNCTNASLGDVWKKCWMGLEKQIRHTCTWKDKTGFYSKSIIEKCSKYCPLECTTVDYEIQTSVAKRPDTSLRIYFGSLRYLLITQEPKIQLIDLISNIGGTLGLFIGLGFVTFFEIFELFIEIVFIKLIFKPMKVKRILP